MAKRSIIWPVIGFFMAIAFVSLGMTVAHYLADGPLLAPYHFALMLLFGTVAAVMGHIGGKKWDQYTEAVQALAQSNKTLEAVIECAPLPIFKVDARGKVKDLWNPAATRLLGWTGEEARNHYLRAVSQTDGKEDLHGFRNSIRQGAPLNGVEMRFRTGDGQTKDFDVFGAPLTDEKGRAQAFIAMLADLTELKEARHLLDRERRQLLSIFDSMDDPIYVSDPDTNELLYVNAALKKYCGDVVGKKCYKVLQNLDEPCSFCTNASLFGENSMGYCTWQYQHRVNGRWFKCMDRAIQWPDGRKVRCEMAFDITERIQTEEMLREAHDEIKQAYETLRKDVEMSRQAEKSLRESQERYQAVFLGAPDAMLVADVKAGRVMLANPAAESLFHQSQESLTGKRMFKLHPPECEYTVRQMFKELADEEKNRPVSPVTTWVIAPDGERISVEVWGSRILFQNQPAVQCVIRDISHRQAFARALDKKTG